MLKPLSTSWTQVHRQGFASSAFFVDEQPFGGDGLKLRVVAPQDPRLPNGGGHMVAGIATAKQTCTTRDAGGACTAYSYVTPPAGLGVTAITHVGDRRNDYWSGVDTNFVLRARGGLRISGGTTLQRATTASAAISISDGSLVVSGSTPLSISTP